MIAQGWPVLSILFICSLISIAVMWDRWRAFRRAKKAMPGFLKQIAARLERLTGAEERERAAQNEIMRIAAPLENRLAILGTIASTAPFIGLFGTVIGIIRSFRAVSLSMSGGHAVVANGIAEALIATAIGLGVAIPAYAAYNYFNRRLQVFEQDLSLAAGDLIYKTR
ncbi:MAG: MotA/TolQ/ExbB proton channel family protein [Elusimicrobia bacterium]|nr:MotA/TolQ/ExbB proton channel family protein [Elusimicrobiota bacterium]